MNITAVSRDKKDEFKNKGFLVNDFCDIRTGLYDIELKKGTSLLADETGYNREPGSYIFAYDGKQIKITKSDFWNIII